MGHIIDEDCYCEGCGVLHGCICNTEKIQEKELLINCIGCGEKRCVDETGWCDNCGGEALAENIEKMKQSIKKKHELMDKLGE